MKLVMVISFQAEGEWKVGGGFYPAGKKQIASLAGGQVLYKT